MDTSDDEILIFDYDNNHLDKDIDPNGGKGKMKASAYNEMMYTAANCDWEKTEEVLRTLVMKGDSERNHYYQKCKAQELAIAAASTPPITNWFSTASTSLLPTTHTYDVEEEEEIGSWKDVDWEAEIKALKVVITTNKNLSKHTYFRLQQMNAYMNLRRNGRKAMEASNLIAEVNDHGPYFARVI